MAGQADVRLCKLGGSWWLAKWMYQALFFSLSSQRSKETKKKGTWSQVTASLRKQPTFGNATRFPHQMMSEKFHTVDVSLPRSDLVNASDWSCFMGHLIEPIRSTNKIWVVMRPQHRISVLLPQTSFGGETGGRVTKCWLFPQAKQLPIDYEHTRHCGDCLCQQTNYAKGILENLSRG